MINAVDLLLIENVENNLIQGFGGGKIASKGLLNNDAHPGIGRGWASETGATELLDDVRINFRRCRKVKETVAADIFGRFQFSETFGELGVGIRIRIVAGTVIKVRSEIAPLFGIDRSDFRNALGGVAQSAAKRFFGHRRARKADHTRTPA